MAKKRPPKVPPKRKVGRPPERILDPVVVAAALAVHEGNVSATAKQFGVTRSAVHNLIHDTPALQVVLGDAREGVLDDAESSLHRAVRDGQGWAVCFFLKTQGRRRGYSERLDELPPLEILLGALPAAVAEVVRRSLAEAVLDRRDPGGPQHA